MALKFLTKPQQMVFAEASTHALTDAWSLLPSTDYDIFFIIENDSSVAELNVQVEFYHSAFGIGLPGGTNLFTPNPVTIPVVPPKAFGVNGQATGSVRFSTPAAGHACIVAKILSNGVNLNQNLTVIGVSTGTSLHGFLVFGFASADVLLTMTETEETPAHAILSVPPSPSWSPVMVAPAGVGAVVVSPRQLRLSGLTANSSYNVGLQITAPATFTNTHIVTVVGTNPTTGEYLGEVQLRFEPAESADPSRPFIHGGYQSEDIILTDPLTGTDVPLGGAPGGSWSTLLRPDTDYGFSARVYNDSDTPAVNTVVRFWNFPGGVSSLGTLVDIQTATIPANSSVIVHSAHPFRSAHINQHSCAVVSIYNASAGRCTVDAVDSAHVPDPGSDHSISCSAWRNTDSEWVWAGLDWHLNLELGLIPKFWGPVPVEITTEAHHVPADFRKLPAFEKFVGVLKSNGLQANRPLFLLPNLRESLKPIDLNIKIAKQDGSQMDKGKTAYAVGLVLKKGNKTGFTVSGTIPKEAKKGDVILVKVTAHYPGFEKTKGKNVEFLQVFHVTEKRK